MQVAGIAAVDAGAPPQAPAEVLVDGEGRVAFVTPEAVAGVVDRDGSVKTLGETVCAKGGRRLGAALHVSLVATGGGFLVACDNGVVLSVE